LAGLPILATALFYLLPSDWQSLRTVQFLPQAAAYAALAAWTARNTDVLARLGLRPPQIGQGLRWGLITGLALGTANTGIILWAVPWLGHDIAFLRETPHAQMPVAVMIPWFILLIALFVEINFRGFLLGRLLALLSGLPAPVAASIAIATSALIFSFDPFMVVTFRHLHWIAVWDGVIWGLLWVRLRNLYAPIIAHAVEVMVMYSVIRAVLIA
jgi:membrane protease YdiL (CAAX protease family)